MGVSDLCAALFGLPPSVSNARSNCTGLFDGAGTVQYGDGFCYYRFLAVYHSQCVHLDYRFCHVTHNVSNTLKHPSSGILTASFMSARIPYKHHP